MASILHGQMTELLPVHLASFLLRQMASFFPSQVDSSSRAKLEIAIK